LPHIIISSNQGLALLQRVAMRLTQSACLRDDALLERVASSTKAF
jgi:hypothetical protein